MYKFKEIADPERSKILEGFSVQQVNFMTVPLTKKLLVALQGMAERSLKGIQGKSFDQLLEMHKNKQSKHYLGKNPDAMDIALYWYGKGELKGFDALPSEVTELYAAFRDYAYRYDAGKGKNIMFSKFTQESDSILELVKEQAPEYYEAFVKANANYKKEVFDRIDGSGVLTKYMKSKSEEYKKLQKQVQMYFGLTYIKVKILKN